MSRAEYWREAFEIACDEAGAWHLVEQTTREQRLQIGESLATSAEHQSMAFYTPDSPLIDENRRLSAKLKWQRELVHCHKCNGSGRLEYNAGPWAVNTQCHTCSGEGKVHPHKERCPV